MESNSKRFQFAFTTIAHMKQRAQKLILVIYFS